MNPEQPQPILVLSRKKPHLIFMMGLSVLSGFASLIGSGNDDPKLPPMITLLWGGFMLFTSGVALISHLQKWDRERGMFFERGALVMQAGTVLAYVLALPVYLGWNIGTVLSIIAGIWWALTNLWEVRLIGADLKMIAAVRRLTPPRSPDARD